MAENKTTTGTNATNNNTTSTNGIRKDGCIVLKIDILKTRFATDVTTKAETGNEMEMNEAAEAIDNITKPAEACELTAIKPENTPFDDAVYFMKNVSGEDFIELVRYAKAHHNKFIGCVKELRGGVNADDVYCSALIELARPLGEKVERRVFNLLSDAVDNEGSIDNFVEFFEALKVING